MLKTLGYSLVASGLCVLLSSCGQPTANDSYIDSKGNTGRFSDHHGRWVVINYWAIWCKPCIEEIPELNEFSHKYSEQASVFSVNFDGKQGEQLIEQSEQLGIEFTTLTNDPAQMLGYERPTVLPTTLIFDQTGKLHSTLLGPQTIETLEKALPPPTQ